MNRRVIFAEVPQCPIIREELNQLDELESEFSARKAQLSLQLHAIAEATE